MTLGAAVLPESPPSYQTEVRGLLAQVMMAKGALNSLLSLKGLSMRTTIRHNVG